MTPFDGKCPSPQKNPTYFCARSYRLKFCFLFLQKVHRGHGVKFSQFGDKCQNLQILSHAFALLLTVSEIKKYLQEVGRGHGVKFSHNYTIRSQMLKSTKTPSYFCATSYHFRDKQKLTSKSRWKPRRTIFAIRRVDGKCKNLQTSFFYFCYLR